MVFPYSVRARGREVAEQVLGLSGRQVRSSGLPLRRPIESGSQSSAGFGDRLVEPKQEETACHVFKELN
jgi:hypothetical protein